MVSIIINVCNNICQLRKTIESIIIQTYEYCEIILVDHGSENVAVNIVQEYQEKLAPEAKLKVIVSGPQCSTADALNNGLSVATGAYIMTCEAGNVLGRRHIEKLIRGIIDMDADIAVGIDGVQECGMYELSENIYDMKQFACTVNPEPASKLYQAENIFHYKLQFPDIAMTEMAFFLQYLYISHTASVEDIPCVSLPETKDASQVFPYMQRWIDDFPAPKRQDFYYILQNIKVREYSRMAMESVSIHSRTAHRRIFIRLHKEIIRTGREYRNYLHEQMQAEVREAQKRYHFRFFYCNRLYRLFFRVKNGCYEKIWHNKEKE